MATQTKTKKKIKWNAFTKGSIPKEALDKIGTYQEAPGGGTPLAKGEKAPSKEWVNKNRRMQPRDDEGRFTYNAANAKTLKYGPSRGYTTPPFLLGVNLTFAEKGSTIKVKDKNKWVYLLSTIDMSEKQMIINCREYIEDEKGFLGMGEGSTINKKGRRADVEKKSKGGIVQGKKVFNFAKASPNTQKDLEEAEEILGKGSASKYDYDPAELGNTKEEYDAWLKKNERINYVIKHYNPGLEDKHIVALIKTGKVKNYIDFFK